MRTDGASGVLRAVLCAAVSGAAAGVAAASRDPEWVVALNLALITGAVGFVQIVVLTAQWIRKDDD